MLDSVGFCVYHFVRCEPGEYIVRLEMHPGDEDYVRFMADTGAEYLGRVMAWRYFRKKAADGPFDLFSDIDSRIAHLDRISLMLAICGGANLFFAVFGTLNPAAGRFSCLNVLVSGLLMYALGRNHGKKEALLRERRLHE